MLTEQDKRQIDLHFLAGVQEGLAIDIARAQVGDFPRHWEVERPPSDEEIEELRRFHANAGAAIKHVETGGSLDDVPTIIWGRHLPPK